MARLGDRVKRLAQAQQARTVPPLTPETIASMCEQHKTALLVLLHGQATSGAHAIDAGEVWTALAAGRWHSVGIANDAVDQADAWAAQDPDIPDEAWERIWAAYWAVEKARQAAIKRDPGAGAPVERG